MGCASRTFRRGLLVCLAAAPVAYGQDETNSAAAFEQAAERARTFAYDGKWEAARRTWLEALRDHAGAPYVRPALPDIREALRSATFWKDHERPIARTLVSGRLKRYDRRNGHVVVSYTPDTLQDFVRPNGLGVVVTRYLMHPVVFRDRYEVTVEGLDSRLPGFVFFVALHEDQGYLVSLGENVEGSEPRPHVIRRIDGERSTWVDEAVPRARKPRARPRRTSARVSVTSREIELSYGGRKVLSVPNESGRFGQVAVTRVGLFGPSADAKTLGFDELEFDGIADRSWIEGLVDQAMDAEWKAFDAAYSEPPELAAWGAPAPVEKSSSDPYVLASQIPFPDRFTPGQVELLREITALLGRRRFDEAHARLSASTDDELPPATRELLLGLALFGHGRYQRALERFEASLEYAAPSAPLRRLLPVVLARAEEHERAIEAYERLIQETPNDPALAFEEAQILLRAGRPDDARARVDAGLAIAPGDAELLELRGQIAKAQQGPAWRKFYREESERFVVASEYDERACRVALKEAEEALDFYEQRFGELGPTSNPTPVYLFAGEAGYERYIGRIAHETPGNTAGIYSSRLKQILAWNVSDRRTLLHTVRHEVAHHYMDARLGDVPRWFGEGLAEFLAVARDEGADWTEGARSFEWVSVLERNRWQTIPLSEFLFQEEPAFLVNAQLAYAQSWAFVTFLLTGDAAQRALCDDLWSILEGSIDPICAIERAFDGLDLSLLEQDFRAYVEALRRG